MNDPAPFMFVTCQVGAEAAVKADVAREYPESRFAYSRPGFLTFKMPAAMAAHETPPLRCVFARTAGWSLGPARGATADARSAAAWQLAAGRWVDRLHVWPRDIAAPGHRGFEPGITSEARAAGDLLCRTRPASIPQPETAPDPAAASVAHEAETAGGEITDSETANSELAASETSSASPPLLAATRRGDHVLDCILVEPDAWWVGFHRARSRWQCWPGGFWPGTAPAELVSRAYLKTCEALDWSGLPMKPGQRVVEIGCAPGGASQALLERGMRVIGIDPAEVDPRVEADPNFEHVRKRGADVRRREFRGAQWLLADANVPPEAALSTLEGIVTHADVKIRGLMVNLKLLDWQLAVDVPGWIERIQKWGFEHVAARQLGHNRQEVCVAAWHERP